MLVKCFFKNNRPIAVRQYMKYVVVELCEQTVCVHGPFYSEVAAVTYCVKLQKQSSLSTYSVTRIIPEKNLSNPPHNTDPMI